MTYCDAMRSCANLEINKNMANLLLAGFGVRSIIVSIFKSKVERHFQISHDGSEV